MELLRERKKERRGVLSCYGDLANCNSHSWEPVSLHALGPNSEDGNNTNKSLHRTRGAITPDWSEFERVVTILCRESALIGSAWISTSVAGWRICGISILRCAYLRYGIGHQETDSSVLGKVHGLTLSSFSFNPYLFWKTGSKSQSSLKDLFHFFCIFWVEMASNWEVVVSNVCFSLLSQTD